MRDWRLATLVLASVGLACSSPGGPSWVYYDTGPGADSEAVDLGVADPGAIPDPGGKPDLGGTPDPGPGDAGPKAIPIKAIQSNAEVFGCAPDGVIPVEKAYVVGAVVTSPKFDAYTPPDGGTALDGYFIADAVGGDWAGIQLVVDRQLGTSFQPGDIIDVRGQVEEYYCLTQLRAEWIEAAGSTNPPTPTVVSPDFVGLEKNESGLLKVQSIEVLEEVASGVYRMTGGFLVSYGFDFYLSLDQGVLYDITGVLSYSFGEYRLLPRSLDDIVEVGQVGPDAADGGGTDASGLVANTTIEAIQSSAASTGCTSDAPETIQTDVVFEGTVAVARYDVSATLHGYQLTDGNGPYQSVMVVVSTDIYTDFQVGAKLRVRGDHNEYYCLTQVRAHEFEHFGTTFPPDPVPVSAGADWEQWEGALVDIPNVQVTSASDADWAQYGYVETDAGLFIDANLSDFPKPQADQLFSQVRGPIRYSYGNYRISPRSAADLVP